MQKRANSARARRHGRVRQIRLAALGLSFALAGLVIAGGGALELRGTYRDLRFAVSLEGRPAPAMGVGGEGTAVGWAGYARGAQRR